MEDEVLEKVSSFIYNRFRHDSTGHDFYHMKRVAKMAKRLAVLEGADPFISETAGWLHDILDPKLTDNLTEAKQEVMDLFESCKIPPGEQERILVAMEAVSFKTGHRIPLNIEGKVVQDADRLDAIGAIGIARAFSFGGARGQALHSEAFEETTIRHFYDKLLKIKGLLNTPSAVKIGQKRHDFLETYLHQFYEEWM
ncbi:HD domain-containing protein [Pontibacillus sp. ALD_SL1]|uniref:HD domain-containing protein n=1 Tax=Pontibacillus sp. ALD_SL1 TaxID=2777185 RepID=UPI001A96A7FA|nr:HD domain-containing protein [Pontibacillus sp. ALD_SL1]QSS98404.1 HD domain-containing protein [Pontibacillus sp. ALD_SL1]